MATITLNDMRSQLMTLDEVRETLAASEPLNEYPLEVGSTHFSLDHGWNHSFDTVKGTDPVNASVRIGDSELRLSKDSLLQATSQVGLPVAYVKKTPAHLIEDQLNYWYGEGRGLTKDLKLLTTGDLGAAVTRATVNPFSNLRILDSVLRGLEDRYGAAEVLVDNKFHHALAGTYLRLIIPSHTFTVEDTGFEDDIWSVGLNIRNSLTGAEQTSIDGYLFRWWCTNGAIDTHASSGVWNRKSGGQDASEVYEWSREVVDSVMTGLEGSFQALQDMARMPIDRDVHQILRDVFDTYTIPARDKSAVIDNMVEDDQLTMYSLMQAITSVANSDEMDPREQARLMSVGGDLPYAATSRCDSCHRLMA